MRLLYITRKYPPRVGGMEEHSYQLLNELKKQTFCKSITWKRSQWLLPLFFCKVLLQTFIKIRKYKITHIHFGDAALVIPFGLLLRIFTNKKLSATSHGKDMTFPNPIYQLLLKLSLPSLGKLITVSSFVAEEAKKRRAKNVFVIPNGIVPPTKLISREVARKKLEKIMNITLSGKKVILSVGRFIRRKGIAEFIDEVMPFLGKNTIYLVGGSGPEEPRIKDMISKKGLSDNVVMLGVVDVLKPLLYQVSDVLVMPNNKINNDPEGFGIVIIEASSYGTPVIATNFDGIPDAIVNGKTGILVKNRKAMIQKISSLKLNRESVRKATAKRFAWKDIAKRYVEVLQ